MDVKQEQEQELKQEQEQERRKRRTKKIRDYGKTRDYTTKQRNMKEVLHQSNTKEMTSK